MTATTAQPKTFKPPAFTKERRLLTSWRENPEIFIQQAILDPYNAKTGQGVSMTAQQREATLAVKALVEAKIAVHKGTATVEERTLAKKLGISIMAGKGIGKDAWLSWMILWFVSLFPYCKVPCTSVSADQLYKVLWSEISKWMETSLVKPWLGIQNDMLYFKDLPEDVVKRRWFAYTKTANPKSSVQEQAETLAGAHEHYVMVAVDEASGIPEAVFQPLESTMTGPVNFMLMIFNPTRSKGYAIDTQYANAQDWITLRWNAEDSEIGPRSEQERLANKYGVDSNPYRIRILGLPPKMDEQTLIPWDWIQEAVDREIEGNEREPQVKGIDCGAGGDASIICTTKGYQTYPLKRLTTPDSTVLINWVGNDIDADRPDAAYVDTIGIGWAVEGGLRQTKGAIIQAADARRTADNPDKYFNKRAEMYDRLREDFERGLISIPNDRDLIEQLGAIRYEYVGSKMKILEKKKLKKLIGHSPDEADALALTRYRPRQMLSKVRVRPMPIYRSQEGAAAWLRA